MAAALAAAPSAAPWPALAARLRRSGLAGAARAGAGSACHRASGVATAMAARSVGAAAGAGAGAGAPSARQLALVTGAGSGIGRALCLVLAARGLRVLGAGRRRAALEETRAQAGEAAAMEVEECDVSRSEDRAALVDRVEALQAEGAPLAYVVHNAGMVGEVGPPSAVTEDGFQKTMAVNVEGPLFLTRALASHLGAAPGGGRVLHISSGAAHSPIKGWLSYCTSKAALLQVARCLDTELSPDVRVGSAMPGVVDTDMQAVIREADFQAVGHFRSLKDATDSAGPGAAGGAGPPPRGALDRPDNVAKFLAWLLLDVPGDEFGGREWDIHDTNAQRRWLAAAS